MSEEQIIQKIEVNREEYIQFLRELIQQDSCNPPGNEKNVAVKVKEFLEKHAIKCKVIPFNENRANLIASLCDDFSKKNLLFNAHMDVVPPGNESEWKYPPLSAHMRRNKIIYGRGAADMKGGLAAMVITLAILKNLDLNLSGNLIFNGVADEETGGILGTGWCLTHELNSIKCDFAIIGEPTGINPLPKAIILGERGHLVVKITMNGIACHSSLPSMGKNAINMMSEFIHHFDKIDNYMEQVKPPLSLEELKELMSKAFPSNEIFEKILSEQTLLQNLLQSLVKFTKSVNMIKGGIKENVVPDKCEAIIDFRLIPGQKIEDVMNALKQVIEQEIGYKVLKKDEVKPNEISVVIEIMHESEGSYWHGWKHSSDLKEFTSIVEKVYKRTPFYFLYPAGADAGYYRNHDYCPATILFGPGSASTAHAIDEFIEVEDFINAIKVYALFAYKFLK